MDIQPYLVRMVQAFEAMSNLDFNRPDAVYVAELIRYDFDDAYSVVRDELAAVPPELAAALE